MFFSTIFTKGANFCDFSFVSLDDRAFGGSTLRPLEGLH